ncbi:MAG: hypothetical protein FJ213_05450 [Ignavibacteria bacterium]|nr:hypothetical protein [Ignavibacteria bacterium]
MKKYYILIPVLISAILIISCSESITGSKVQNVPPETHIFLHPDSGKTISQQSSKLKVHWWGDDPDGFVIGYLISWDQKNYGFTPRNDSTFSLVIRGLDTSYIFSAAAVDNAGNKKYDQTVVVNGINYGSEPFTDSNNNGKWDEGEPFIDFGAIDPTPAHLTFPIKNSPPIVSFQQNSQVPETTFTVASFAWNISDVDGDETVQKVFIALNDTASFIELPGSARFVTIRAKAPFSSSTVSADVFIGTTIGTPYSIKLPNLKLDEKNIFYVKAIDIAGTFSKMIQMPDTGKAWFVKKQKGNILIIDDYGVNDQAASFYNATMDSINSGILKNKYDLLDIKYGKTSTTPGVLLPKFTNPTFTEMLKLFKVVIWYTDNDPSLEIAQLTVRNYTESGGKILLSMVFPQTFDTRGLSDFLPIDSVSPTPINIIPMNTKINLTADGTALGYSPLSIDNSTIPVARIRTFFPSAAGAKNLYTLGLTGNPIIGFKDIDTRRIFLGLPLHRCNGAPSNTKEFLRKVLIDEFGVTP